MSIENPCPFGLASRALIVRETNHVSTFAEKADVKKYF